MNSRDQINVDLLLGFINEFNFLQQYQILDIIVWYVDQIFQNSLHIRVHTYKVLYLSFLFFNQGLFREW